MSANQFSVRCVGSVCAVAVAAALSGAPILAESLQARTGQTGQKPATPSATRVDAANLSDHPERYYQKRVSVKEEVEHVLGPNLFTLSDGEFFGSSPDILVFAPQAEAMPNEDTTVTVTGTLHKFTYADLRRDYGWGWGYYPWGAGYYGYGYPWYAPVGQDYWVRYENRPLLIATSVVSGAGVQLVSDTSSTQPGVAGTSGRSADANVVTDISKLSGASSAQYAGRRAHLDSVTVDRVTSPRGFWTKSGIFVALDQDIRDANLKAGEQVTVAGRVATSPKNKSRIDMKTWGFTDEDATRLMSDRVFIKAQALTRERQQ